MTGSKTTEPSAGSALPIYCVKCKKRTATHDIQPVVTRNGHPAERGRCADCNTVKLRFLKGGKGLVNKILNAPLPEMHLPGYSFCGPYTKLAKRLARGDRPKNALDRACQAHDMGYEKVKDAKTRHQYDRALEEAAKHVRKNKSESFRNRAEAALVQGTMHVKRKLGMGNV